jgi:hypothetical protein
MTPIERRLPFLDNEGRLVLEPHGKLKVKTKVFHSRDVNKYLIKWRNLSKDDVTWENEEFKLRH